MMMVHVLLLGIICLLSSFNLINCFFLDQRRAGSRLIYRIYESKSDQNQEKKDFTRWSNPSYPKEAIEKWWLSNEHLLTVGSKGVTESQINSLRELISQHEVVRIKLTSDKMNAMEISKVFSDDEKVSQTCELLEVRIKGFMFGRKSLRQSEARKKKV